MGYLHIDNLYKNQAILLFKKCYALEKIHGTSAHLGWKDGSVRYFSGGESHEKFKALFDDAALVAAFSEIGHDSMTIFGEAYGGKCQGMSKTYGKELRFVAFDVKIGDSWLKVPSAHEVVTRLGLEFVWYMETDTDIAELDALRDRASEQAYRNGCADREDAGTWRIMEGVVLRPIEEFHDNAGNRVISKHKREEFRERASIPDIDPAKRELLTRADDIAQEWVTDMRLSHVLDKMGNPTEMSAIPAVISAMQEDVTREGSGEIIDNQAVRKAIGTATVKLYKKRINAMAGLMGCTPPLPPRT